MEQKNLLIGAFSNYNYRKLSVWINSALEHCTSSTDIVLIGIGHIDDETKSAIAAKIQLVLVEDIPALHPHVKRFVYLYDYIKHVCEKYHRVVTTDVRDVFFQSCPFSWMDKNLVNFEKLVCSSEGLLYKNEPWGNENLLHTVGQYFYNDFKDKEIFNAGVLAGDTNYIRDLCLLIFQMSLQRATPMGDQAVYNVLMHSMPYYGVAYHANQESDGWACQAGTTADPSKIDSFRAHLLCAEPKMKNGVFVAGNTNKKFAIVHQYDRVPEWNSYIEGKYGHY